jgi:transposase
MLSVSAAYHYFLYRGITDFRSGFDSLSGLVRAELDKDPTLGDVFIFFNRKRNQVKLLHFEGDGFALYHKRLESGTYEVPDASVSEGGQAGISSDELLFILKGIKLRSIERRARFNLKKHSEK